MNDLRERFRDLHRSGLFLLANAWDVGSARILAELGFAALATTSGGHAGSLGRMDGQVTRDELVAHVASLCAAVDLPINVDAERCFADDAAGIAETIDLLAEAGAAGISIEDYNPATDSIEPVAVAVERVAAAVEAGRRHGVVLTARAENHLHGVRDLDDTIARLQAYHAAGAEVVYAPGLRDLADIGRLVAAVDAPVNVLAFPKMASAAELGAAGVRRVSIGGQLTMIAYGAMAAAAQAWLDEGSLGLVDLALPVDLRARAFAR